MTRRTFARDRKDFAVIGAIAADKVSADTVIAGRVRTQGVRISVQYVAAVREDMRRLWPDEFPSDAGDRPTTAE